MASNYRFGPDASGWKGGRYKDSDGYIVVYCPEHPFANKHRHVKEHRLIMEEYLCAHLLPFVDVHHKNHIRDDNRIQNLELLSHRKHASLSNPKKDKTGWTCSECSRKPNHAHCNHSQVKCKYNNFWHYRKGHKYDLGQLLCYSCYNRNRIMKLQENSTIMGLFLDR